MTPNSPSSHGSAESKHRSVQETEQFKKEENKHDEGEKELADFIVLVKLEITLRKKEREAKQNF
nr:11267_t:CDS:2 [Entrophospora candida]CAG8495186.1 8313_t:CDS:2 [Entrophospora candida]